MERRFLILFFVYLVIEGALRKWFFPSFSKELFLLKDGLLMFAVLGYMGRIIFFRRRNFSVFSAGESMLLWIWGLFFCWYSLISGFSFITLIGLRYYLVMLPIVFILPNVINSIDDLNRLARIYLGIALCVGLLGIVQYFSSPSSIINKYVWDIIDIRSIATFGEGKTRITGTFSYISPYGVYLEFVFLIGLALFYLTNKKKMRIFLGMVIAIIFINVGMTGSRAVFLISVIFAVIFLWNSFKSSAKQKGKGFSLLLGLLIFSLFIYQFSDVFTSLSKRNMTAGDSSLRVTGALLMPINTLATASFLGTGIGSTFMGMRVINGSLEKVAFDEVNVDRIGVELGVLGYLFILFFKMFFLIKTWLLYIRSKCRPIKIWILVPFCYQLSLLWVIPVYNSIAMAFYFTSLGIYVLLHHFERQEILRGSI